MGKLPVIRTLATLAHDCRRSELFQGELIAALEIVQRGDLPLRDLIGAYAGEIGQTQFLPSSYIKYGVDFDGNGHVDLRHSVPDVLASTANLLKTNGWQAGEPYGEGTGISRRCASGTAPSLSQDHGAVRRAARGGEAARSPLPPSGERSRPRSGPGEGACRRLIPSPPPRPAPHPASGKDGATPNSSPSIIRISRTAPSPSAFSASWYSGPLCAAIACARLGNSESRCAPSAGLVGGLAGAAQR